MRLIETSLREHSLGDRYGPNIDFHEPPSSEVSYTDQMTRVQLLYP
jgi:hypothetical protein